MAGHPKDFALATPLTAHTNAASKGGGDGVRTSRGGGAGGGSGYLQYQSINGLFPSNIIAKVGKQKMPSIVTIANTDAITALNGKSASEYANNGAGQGGNGYCGGGWWNGVRVPN